MALSRPARGLLVGALTIVLALAMLAPLRSDIDTATAALVLVFPGVAAAIAGGRLAALVSAVASAAVFNVVFLRPYEAERRAAAERRAFEVADARAATDRAVAEAMALGLAGEHRAALLRSVSHDLRTPLSTIRAVASDLRDGGGEYDESTREELLDLVVDEAERLDRFVANLLSLSRVDAGALEADRQAIALDELLDQCVRRHARLVRDRKVSVDVPLTLPLVDADWTLVDQAVTNLVANAVRHAPAGSRIWVSAREVEPGWVEVRVTDQGPGIPAAERAAAFQPFRRGPGSSSSGVGLAIVRAVVDAHGGEVGIEEGPAGGTSVRFTLPVHRD